jgi:hypothetical protein
MGPSPEEIIQADSQNITSQWNHDDDHQTALQCGQCKQLKMELNTTYIISHCEILSALLLDG